MTITERQLGTITVLTVSGKVALEHSGRLKAKVTSALDAGHTKDLPD
jgi:hypothetical protein